MSTLIILLMVMILMFMMRMILSGTFLLEKDLKENYEEGF